MGLIPVKYIGRAGMKPYQDTYPDRVIGFISEESIGINSSLIEVTFTEEASDWIGRNLGVKDLKTYYFEMRELKLVERPKLKLTL